MNLRYHIKVFVSTSLEPSAFRSKSCSRHSMCLSTSLPLKNLSPVHGHTNTDVNSFVEDLLLTSKLDHVEKESFSGTLRAAEE